MTDLQKDVGHHPIHLQILLIEEVAKEEELMQGEEGHHHLLAHPLHQVLLIRRVVRKESMHEEPTEGAYDLNGHGKGHKSLRREGIMSLFSHTMALMDKWIRY